MKNVPSSTAVAPSETLPLRKMAVLWRNVSLSTRRNCDESMGTKPGRESNISSSSRSHSRTIFKFFPSMDGDGRMGEHPMARA